MRPCRTETVHLDDFGPKMCKLRQSRALFGGLLYSKMPPPAEAVPDITRLTDQSIRITRC